ncbi:MAG TPA: NUDIX domain-containing protein [Candidatus Saccharimonadales bacterium]|jgi:8-oxo-dGTP diphosphatase
MIKVATLWLVNEYSEILLAQRSFKKENEPGMWGPSVTGRLEPSESVEEALLREVEEELGLKPTDYEPHYLMEIDFDHPDGTTRRFYAYYAVVSKAITDSIRLQESEVEGVAWDSLPNIQSRMQQAPEELVPSVNDVWPATFQALRNAKVI